MLNFILKESPDINDHKMVEVHVHNVSSDSLYFEMIGPLLKDGYYASSDTLAGKAGIMDMNTNKCCASTDYLGGIRKKPAKKQKTMSGSVKFRMPAQFLKKELYSFK